MRGGNHDFAAPRQTTASAVAQADRILPSMLRGYPT